MESISCSLLLISVTQQLNMLGLSLDSSNLGGADPRLLMATGAVLMTYLGFKLIGPKKRRPGPYPDGPTGLPVVGNLFQLGKNPHLKFMEWSKKYGKVFSIKLGVHDVIVINGWKAYRQALIYQAESFAGRPNFYTFRNIICDGKTLAFNTYSDRFKQHKKILVEGLKSFLQSNDPPIDVAVLDEAKILVKHLQNDGKPVEPYTPLLNSCLYVICGLIFGYNSDLCKDRAKVNAIGNVDETRDAEGAGSNVVDFFPFIRPLLMGTLKGMLEECTTRMAMIRQLEKEHRENYDENALRDLMDHLIKAADNMNADQVKAGLTSEHIMSTAFTLLNAGSDTLAGMLYWASLYAANYPDVQEKIIAEIDEVIGGDRMPSVEDRPHLQYTEAFLNEVMRYCVLTPFLIPHAATRDVKYMGYVIPEGTVVFCNMW